MLYPVDQGIQASHKGEERLPRPRRGCDHLIYREGTPRVALLPAGYLVEDVAFHITFPLVDGDVLVLVRQALFPMLFAPAHAEGMPLRLRCIERHQRGEVFFSVGPEIPLF